MPLLLPKAELLGTLLEAAGYGAYAVVFLECMQILWKRYRQGRDMRYLFVTATTIFSLITAHLIIDVVRVLEAFTADMARSNGPVLYYAHINTQLNLAKTATYVAVTLVLDGLIVYRTFVVWNRGYTVVAPPSLLLLADIVLSSWATWSITQVAPGDAVMVAAVTLRVKYFYVVTLALNLFCSLAIAWKIWTIHRNVDGHSVSGVRFMGVISVIVESAFIYTLLLTILIVTSVVASTAMFIVLNAISPIIGMVFSAVIVRASKEYHADTFLTTDLSLALATPTALDPPSSAGWPTDRKSRTSSELCTYAPEQRPDPRSPLPSFARSRVHSPVHVVTDVEMQRFAPGDEDGDSVVYRGYAKSVASAY